jgi:hypothetical protein
MRAEGEIIETAIREKRRERQRHRERERERERCPVQEKRKKIPHLHI